MKCDPEAKDYREYVIKDGKFIGNFEQMYQDVENPWCLGDAEDLQYRIIIELAKMHLAHNKPSITILDIGCGKGAFTHKLAQEFPQAKITGIDISPTAIKKAKKAYPDKNITFKAGDIQKEYQGMAQKHDIIILSQIMWYILPDFGKIVKYLMANCLTENGMIVINQVFYDPDVQKYGKEIVSKVEDMIRLIGHDPVELVEINRFTNHVAVGVFKNKNDKD